MQIRGTIYHHEELVFHNGFTGRKYLVLLNSPSKGEPYLLVKTTSQKKDKPSTPVCIKDRSLFFIASGKTFFPKDTWVQLYELYIFQPKDIDSNPDISIVGDLKHKVIDEIVNCLFETEEDNIAPINKKLLRPPLQSNLLKLQEMFNKKR